MNWNEDARSSLAKAPFFVRGMITKRVEKHVLEHGRETVTLADLKELRASVMGESDEQARLGGLTSEQIASVVRNSRPQLVADERTYEVKVCNLAGCPRELFDARSLAEKMVGVIEESGVPEAVARRVSGPILRHHRLTVSISGCPNSCSQPQIADFGVQGRARPVIGNGICSGCGACVRACAEAAVMVTRKTPVFAAARCIDCGDCIRACPSQAITTWEYGFSALIGGKLGRHPQLARTLFGFTDERTLLSALRITCGIFASELKPGERLANAIDRIGLEEIARRCG
ncbi:MAG: 4Fe-4S binding protein [Armatimonadetes bacterium]|nr:4Fe-4S binding protein [Armatimonadota bacterium]